MIKFGILGLGSKWESCYHPALLGLRQHVQVRALFDPVISRALSAGRELNAILCDGINSLLTLPDLDAILVLDSSWYGRGLIDFLVQSRKPCYLGTHLDTCSQFLGAAHENAKSVGQTIMPELSLRYTPASNRLRELCATSLGNPRHIEIYCHCDSLEQSHACNLQDAHEGMLISLFDWCRYILGFSANSIQMVSEGTGSLISPHTQDNRITMEFKSQTTDREPVTVSINYFSKPESSNAPPEGFRMHVLCESGALTVLGDDRIEWEHEGRSVQELLSAERSSVEVMLDHFCRRVVGGLIPLADLNDLGTGASWYRAAFDSLADQKPINLNGNQ